MLEFVVKKDFPIAKNMRTYLRVSSVYYNLTRDGWLFDLYYFYDRKNAQFYRIAEFLIAWVQENPHLINEKSWMWIHENYLSRDLTKLPLLVETIKLKSTDFLIFGKDITPDKTPIIVEEFWYNKTREDTIKWARDFIIKNKGLFQINEMIESSGTEDEFKEEIMAPIISKIKEME